MLGADLQSGAYAESPLCGMPRLDSYAKTHAPDLRPRQLRQLSRRECGHPCQNRKDSVKTDRTQALCYQCHDAWNKVIRANPSKIARGSDDPGAYRAMIPMVQMKKKCGNHR